MNCSSIPTQIRSVRKRVAIVPFDNCCWVIRWVNGFMYSCCLAVRNRKLEYYKIQHKRSAKRSPISWRFFLYLFILSFIIRPQQVNRQWCCLVRVFHNEDAPVRKAAEAYDHVRPKQHCICTFGQFQVTQQHKKSSLHEEQERHLNHVSCERHQTDC